MPLKQYGLVKRWIRQMGTCKCHLLEIWTGGDWCNKSSMWPESSGPELLQISGTESSWQHMEMLHAASWINQKNTEFNKTWKQVTMVNNTILKSLKFRPVTFYLLSVNHSRESEQIHKQMIIDFICLQVLHSSQPTPLPHTFTFPGPCLC